MTILRKLNYKTIITTSNFYLLLLFIFWMPLNDDFLPLIMTLWIFTWLLEGNFKNRFQKFYNWQYYVGFVLYFLLTCIALFKANNIDDGFFEVQEKLSMIFFPVILVGSNQQVKRNFNLLLVTFILGNLFAAIYCLINATISSIVVENGELFWRFWVYDIHKEYSFFRLINERYNHFSYSFLSVFKHPSYFSLYLIFSICILIYFIKKKIFRKRIFKIASFSLILFFTFCNYLLQSRAGIISLAIVFLSIIMIEIQRKFRKRYLLITVLFISFFGVVVIPPHSKTQQTIIQLYDMYINPTSFSIAKSDARFQTWYTSIQIIKENLWFGTGPANLTNEMVTIYKQYGFESAVDAKLNSHNQYLEAFAGLGILGFFSLMYIIIGGFIISIKRKHYLLFFLLLILSINFLFESMLNRMAGILFMMFFISLFLFMNNQKKEQNDNNIALET